MNGIKKGAAGIGGFAKKHIVDPVKNVVKKGLGIFSPSRVFHGYGVNILEGLIRGMRSKTPTLEKVMDRLAAYIAKQGQKIADLMSKKADVISSFRGLKQSVFGAMFQDAEGNDRAGSVSDLLDFQKQQLARARQVQADVKALVARGLSKALIQQMIDAGDSGLANLHTLASGGSVADIKALNSLDRSTNYVLTSAGNLAGDRLYGQAIKKAERREDLAKAIARELRAVLREQGKDEYVVKLGADAVIRIIRQRAKEKGVTVAQLLAAG
jgi:hypothetical protein